jgi:hypothetical protein
MGVMMCKTHGRVNFVETCSHIAKQIDSQHLPRGRRLTIMGHLFVCEACFVSLGFDRFNDLDGLPPEELADVDDVHWKACGLQCSRRPANILLEVRGGA